MAEALRDSGHSAPSTRPRWDTPESETKTQRTGWLWAKVGWLRRLAPFGYETLVNLGVAILVLLESGHTEWLAYCGPQ